jgi:hypothetical protein
MSRFDIDPVDASWIAFARIFVGVFWLYEVFLGGRWKLGTPGTGPNPDWVGATAGGEITEVGNEALADGTWTVVALTLETVILPHAAFWANVVTFSQVAFGVLMILGAFVRLASIGAISQLGLVVAFGPAGIGPILMAGHLFALATDAGQHYGVDGWLSNRSGNDPLSGFGERIATVGSLPERALPGLAAGAGVSALYFLFIAVAHGGEEIPGASLELGVFSGLAGFGLWLAYRGVAGVSIGAEVLRVFVGYRLLHEIFVSTDATLDKMPGWAAFGELGVTFEEITVEHFAVIGSFVDVAFLPAVEAWAVAFAVVQTAVGVALLVGYRTRTASALGIAYVGVLITLGFTRYTPFLFGLLIATWALGGRSASLDSATERIRQSPRLARWDAPIALSVAVVATIVALVTGVAPDGYVSTMGPVVAAMIAIFTALVGLTALSHHRLPKIDRQETAEARPTSD